MSKTRLYTEIALILALAVVLDMISKTLLPLRLPYGGGISLRALPIIILALRHGIKIGCTAGAIYGLIDCMLQPVIVHSIQFVLDYPVAFAGLGLVGLYRLFEFSEISYARKRIYLACFIFVGYAARFLSHFLSGFIFFGHYAPKGQSVWVYALTYNIGYLGPECLILIFLTPFIMVRLPH